MTRFLVILGIATFIGLVGWFQYSLWSECRQTNSFFYCLRVLNK